jgi:hypothetical protein
VFEMDVERLRTDPAQILKGELSLFEELMGK